MLASIVTKAAFNDNPNRTQLTIAIMTILRELYPQNSADDISSSTGLITLYLSDVEMTRNASSAATFLGSLFGRCSITNLALFIDSLIACQMWTTFSCYRLYPTLIARLSANTTWMFKVSNHLELRQYEIDSFDYFLKALTNGLVPTTIEERTVTVSLYDLMHLAYRKRFTEIATETKSFWLKGISCMNNITDQMTYFMSIAMIHLAAPEKEKIRDYGIIEIQRWCRYNEQRSKYVEEHMSRWIKTVDRKNPTLEAAINLLIEWVGKAAL